MGAEQSKSGSPDDTTKSFSNAGPIQFSQDLVNHLSDNLTSPTPDSNRQHTLDEHVRSRIHAELARLRTEEEHVRREIETALEKENLDREAALVASDDVPSSSSSGLKQELDEVQKRAERFLARKSLADLPEVKAKQEALLQCYLNNPKTSLDCWQEVEEFKQSVAVLEKKFVDTLR